MYQALTGSPDRQVKAQAFIRLAEAYRRIGDPRARNTFEQALQFSDAPSVATAVAVYERMLAGCVAEIGYLIEHRASVGALKSLFVGVGMHSSDLALALAAVGVLLIADHLSERRPVRDRLQSLPAVARWAFYYAGLACLLFLGSSNQSISFVYYQY